jgi:hypothetical protein
VSDAQHPSAPAPGSRRYYTLLYTPEAHREELNTLLAVAEEIAPVPTASADHSVAHVRLEWWRDEAGRFARGEPQHPWLRTLLREHPSSARLDLLHIVDAAAMDLATRTLSARQAHALRRALFEEAAGALLAQPLGAALRECIGELGASLERLEDDPEDVEARATLRQRLGQISAALQPALAPLLVWLALAARSRQHAALFESLSDNFTAWSAARRAARGRFTLQ